MTQQEYNPAEDARLSYDAAIAAKKARGDRHYPMRESERGSSPDGYLNGWVEPVAGHGS